MLSFLRKRPKRYSTPGQAPTLINEINDRQNKLPGYSYEKWQNTSVFIVGAGSLGAYAALQCMNKGAGHIENCDDDVVSLSNIPRQPFSAKDVGKYKATILAKQLCSNAPFPLTTVGYPNRFQELFDLDDVEHPGIDLVICGVDNNTARRAVSAWAYRHNIPAIIAGFAIDSSSGYVMTQVPSETCWLCMFPQFENDGSYPCALPSTGDIVAITTGWMGYAADTFVGTRGREWNLKTFYLDGALPDRTVTILPRPSCPICDRQPTTLAA